MKRAIKQPVYVDPREKGVSKFWYTFYISKVKSIGVSRVYRILIFLAFTSYFYYIYISHVISFIRPTQDYCVKENRDALRMSCEETCVCNCNWNDCFYDQRPLFLRRLLSTCKYSFMTSLTLFFIIYWLYLRYMFMQTTQLLIAQ